MAKEIIQIKATSANTMNIQVEGNPLMLVDMISIAMDNRQDVAGIFIAGVLKWCDNNKIPRESLGHIVNRV